MLVYLAGSLRNESDGATLEEIKKVIQRRGGSLVNDWIPSAVDRLKKDVKVKDWEPIVEESIAGIERADIVIIEASHNSFSQGYLMAAALEHQKPVLILSKKPLAEKTAELPSSPLLTTVIYSATSALEEIVHTFIRKNTIHTKDLRFNMLMTRRVFNYLDERSNETGVSMSEIVRDMIKRASKGGK